MNSQIVERLRHALHEHCLPGLAVVIRQHNDDVFAGGVGCFDAAAQHPVKAQTPFGVASLTKLVTTLMVLLLQQRGALSVDDLLVRYFPSFKLAQRVPIRLTHLLSHSAGLPGLPGRFYARNLDDMHDRSGGVGQRGRPDSSTLPAGLPNLPTIVDANELVELINQLDVVLLAPPGELLNYSNEGFCLLGGVVEQVMGRPYAELVQEMVFAPLQMDQSGVGSASGAQPSNAVALPLHRDGSGYRAAGFWRAPLFYPAGGCVCSARDIIRLIGSLVDNVPLLSQDSKRQIRRAHVPVASRPGAGIGYGWGLEFQQIDADTTMLWHSGQRAGVSSFMGCLVEQEMLVSVLCNVADVPVTSIAHDLIGEVLGRSDICWPPTGLTGSVDPVAPERFPGRYASEEGSDFVVERGNRGLMLNNPRSSRAQPLLFAGSDYGTVGTQTFRFLSEPTQSQAWAIALDLRVLPRVV